MEVNNIAKNFLWRLAERIGAQGVKLVVEIVLARLLFPDDYGIIAIVAVFITIFNVFVDSGLGNALVQKKDADDIDFSSVFWFNIVWCIILYFVFFLISPYVASFYGKTELTLIMRVLGLQVIISGVKNVEQAYVFRTMQFRKFFFSTLGGTIGAAVIGIALAYSGWGVWALVAQQIFNILVDTIILWLTVKWRPKVVFSFSRLKKLLSFGWKLLASALLDTVYNEARQLVIGKIYSSADLAFYNRGQQFPMLFINNVNSSIDSILLPSMSRVQDDRQRIKSMTKRAIQVSTYIIAPLMMGLASIGEPIVRLLLTEKWLSTVPFMRIYCIAYMFYPIHTANLNALKAMGRSDLFLKLEIVKKIIGMIALLITMNISVMAMAYSLLLMSILSQIINSWPNRRLLNYSYIEQLKDILPSIFLSAFMGFSVYFLNRIELPYNITLVIQVLVGVTFYIGGSKLLKFESYEYVKNIAMSFLKRKNKV